MAAKNQKQQTILDKITQAFRSNKFFYTLLGFLIISSSYVAVVSLYPMAFDEEVHYGIIKAYSESFNPFAITQLPEYDDFGAIETDPSYLFHYLMSYPYRLFDAVFTSDTSIIIALRLINVGLFTAALIVFRKLLLSIGTTRAVAHVVLAIVVLVPVVPLLAGQINYDNLIMLMTASLLWAAWYFREMLRANNPSSVSALGWTACLALFGSVVKYAFLPIIMVVFFFVIYQIVQAIRRTGFSGLLHTIRAGFTQLSWLWRSVLIVALLLGSILFAQRYVVNLVQYGSLVPDCAKVLGVDRCRSFGPYGRDYNYRNDKAGLEVRSLPHYTATHFAWGLWHRLYFTVAGPTNNHANFRHLPIMSHTALVIIAIAAIATLVYFRKIFNQYPAFWLFLAITVVYIGILLFQLYGTYASTARPAAINGRYLIPILPLVGAIGATALVEAVRSLRAQRYLGIAAVVIFLLLLQGGGPFSYIISADSSWFWNDPSAQINNTLDKILSPFIYGR